LIDGCRDPVKVEGLEPAGARSVRIALDSCLVACPLPDCAYFFGLCFCRLRLRGYLFYLFFVLARMLDPDVQVSYSPTFAI
jgi:hypothetical protein